MGIRNKRVGLTVILLALLAGMVVALVTQRTRVAQMAIDRVLAGSGLVEARCTVDRIGLRSASFSGILLSGDFWRVEVDAVRVDYDWRMRRIRLIESGSGRIRVDVDAVLEAPSERTLDELADRVEEIRDALPELPFILGPIAIAFRFREIEKTVWMEGKGRLAADPMIEGQFGLDGELGKGEIEVSRPVRSSPMAIAGSWVTHGDPLGPARQFFPDWAESLPASLGDSDPSVGSVNVHFRLEQERLRPVAFDLEAIVNDLGLTIGGRRLAAGRLDSHLKWDLKDDPVVSLDLGDFQVRSKDLQVTAERVSTRAVVGRSLEIGVPAIGVDSNLATGRIGLLLSSPWPTDGAIPMGATLAVDVFSLRAGGLDWDPIRLGMQTGDDEVVVEVPRLAPSESFWPVLSDFILRVTLADERVDALSAEARVVFGDESVGSSGRVTGSDLFLTAALSGMASDSMRTDVRIASSAGGGSWKVAKLGTIETNGELTVAAVEALDGIRADLALVLGPSVIRVDSGMAALASIDLKVALPPLTADRLRQIPDAPLRDRIDLAKQVKASLTVIGDRLEWTGGLMAEWFDLTGRWGRVMEETDEGDSKLDLLFQAATLGLGSERLHSVRLEHGLTTGDPLAPGAGRLEALFDGVPLALGLADGIHFGPDGEMERLTGEVTLETLRLEYSDLLARHLPQFSGLSLGATLEGRFQAEWSPEGAGDASGDVTVRDGSLFFPPQNLHLEGLQGTFALESLRHLRTRPDLVWSFDRLAVTDLELRDGRVVFGLSGPDRVAVSALSFEAFEGRFQTDPFVYQIADRSVELDVKVNGLNAGALVDHLNFFNGRFEGYLSGSVPFRMKNGSVEPLKGHLELDSSLPSHFRYEADGLLTGGEQARTLKDKLRLLPLKLVEDGLKDMQVQALSVDLFDPAWPETPVRIHLAGQAVTSEAVVPYVITAKVNGTVAEALNFLFRLASL